MKVLSLSSRPLPGVVRAGASLGGILLLGLTLPPLSATRILTWPWALGTAALWSLPIGFVLFRLACGTAWVKPPALLSFGLFAFAAISLCSALVSPFTAASCSLLAPTLGGIALFFLSFDFLADDDSAGKLRRHRLTQLLAWGGGIVVVVSLGGWLYKSGGDLAIRNDVPFGHSNYTAGCMVLLLPWLSLRVYQTERFPRVGWALAGAGALAALAATNSRGGLLALGVVTVVGLGVTLIKLRRSFRWKLAMVVSALAIAALVVVSNSRLRELVSGGGWNEAARESNRQRWAMLQGGWQLGLERPLLGWGPGTVPLAFPLVRSEISSGVENVLQLHSTPAQLWASLGAAGMIAALLILVGGIKAFSTWTPQPPALAATASLAGFAIMSLTDHQLDVPAMTVLGVAALVLLCGTPARAVWRPHYWVSALLFVLVCAGLARPAAFWVRDVGARANYNDALTALEGGNADGFLTQLDQAARLAPWDPYFLQRKANFFIVAREMAADKNRKNALAALAVANLEASLKTGTHQEYAYFNLGWLELELGRPDLAARHFAAAARLVPDKAGVYLGLGLSLQSQSKTASAVRAYALAWINDPHSTTDPMWEQPDFAALVPAIRAEVLKLYVGLRTTVPEAARAECWTRWWWGENVALDQPGRGFNGQADQFVTLQPAIKARASIPGSFAWMDLYRAWSNPSPEVGFSRFAPPLGTDLTTVARAHPESFQAFLTSPVHEFPSLVKTLHFERTGYGVLARHPDGPPLVDAYVAQHNVLSSDFAPAFFPAKGWLPGRLLLSLLPPDAR